MASWRRYSSYNRAATMALASCVFVSRSSKGTNTITSMSITKKKKESLYSIIKWCTCFVWDRIGLRPDFDFLQLPGRDGAFNQEIAYSLITCTGRNIKLHYVKYF